MTKTTICFLLRKNEILLAMKKRGFGAGKWNGAGGKLCLGESFEDSVKREVLEEIGVTIVKMEHVGTLVFHFAEAVDKMGTSEVTRVYFCHEWKGEPSESEEMKPKWFAIREIPYELMWEDDIFWLPHTLKKKFVKGEFTFDNKFKLINIDVKYGEEKVSG